MIKALEFKSLKIKFVLFIAGVLLSLILVWVGVWSIRNSVSLIIASTNYSVRFKGDRSSYIGIPIESINVGRGDFTLEFWLKHEGSTAPAGNICIKDEPAVYRRGSLIIDRTLNEDLSRFGNNEEDLMKAITLHSEWGIALMGDNRLAFGLMRLMLPVSSLGNGGERTPSTIENDIGLIVNPIGMNVCSSVLEPNVWHHIVAVRHRAFIRLYVNGELVDVNEIPIWGYEAFSDFSYHSSRPNPLPADPYLVLGAEKYAALSNWMGYPNYHYKGLLDDFRISNIARYLITPPQTPSSPLEVDINTVALYRFERSAGSETDRGNEGLIVGDVTYVTDSPFAQNTISPSPSTSNTPIQTLTPTPTLTPTNTPTATAKPTYTPTPTRPPTPTSTPRPVNTPTPTQSRGQGPVYVNPPVAMTTPTPTVSPTPTATVSPTNTVTQTPTLTKTPTPTNRSINGNNVSKNEDLLNLLAQYWWLLCLSLSLIGLLMLLLVLVGRRRKEGY